MSDITHLHKQYTFFRLFKGFAREMTARYRADPYNMLAKMEMPGFWGVQNITDIEFGVPGHAQLAQLQHHRDKADT